MDGIIALKKAISYADNKFDGSISDLTFKGSVSYIEDLPASPELGDTYIVLYRGTSGTDSLKVKYIYDGSDWIEYGFSIFVDGQTLVIN